MKVAAAQMDIVWHDQKSNHETIQRMATAAKEAAADMVVFPEMAATGFSMDTSITAEPIDGPRMSPWQWTGRETTWHATPRFIKSVCSMKISTTIQEMGPYLFP